MYPKLAGMTGTAATEAEEFHDIYKLEVVEVPTHQPMVRQDEDDEVYRNSAEKMNALIDLVEECQGLGQPCLVGTVSIEKSEVLAAALKERGVPHRVLNARYHEQEAHIIAQAGRLGAVTIATNMAGRGTDIKLGGNVEMRIADEVEDSASEEERASAVARFTPEVETERQAVMAAGGLFVIGTERHESRRIDNQLRGRSARQGDPGRSKFFLSLDDDLMRIFGSERMDGMLRRLGLKDGEAIVHPWINKALEKAQKKVEARNFDIRKNLLKFDDVMNDQRKVIYDQRIDLMKSTDVSETFKDMRDQVLEDLVATNIPEKAYAEQWKTETLALETKRIFALDLPLQEWAAEEGIANEEILHRLADAVNKRFAEKATRYGPDVWRVVEKSLILQVLDQHWKDHLLGLDHLRQGIGLRAYGQRDPLNEYKGEAFNMFETMLSSLRVNLTSYLSNVELKMDAPAESQTAAARPAQSTEEIHNDPSTRRNDMDTVGTTTLVRGPKAGAARDPDNPATWGKVGRNEICPCESGKKYKQCHGRLA
jgi:preprotein translocase subunit SecA